MDSSIGVSRGTVQAHFYCIRISALGEADMANNQDSGLFAKTGKASMGECDAFISHSWRDDPALKWQRMLEFRAEFESKSERGAPGTRDIDGGSKPCMHDGGG